MIDPVPMRMNDASALKLLREIAEDSGRVIFTRHALQRMRQRKVSTAQVLTCLRDETGAARIRRFSDGATQFDVTGTPTFILNGQKLDSPDAATYEGLSHYIDQAIAGH